MAKKSSNQPIVKNFSYEVSEEQFQAMPTPVLLNWFHIAQTELKTLEKTSKLRRKLLLSMELAEQEYSFRK